MTPSGQQSKRAQAWDPGLWPSFTLHSGSHTLVLATGDTWFISSCWFYFLGSHPHPAHPYLSFSRPLLWGSPGSQESGTPPPPRASDFRITLLPGDKVTVVGLPPGRWNPWRHVPSAQSLDVSWSPNSPAYLPCWWVPSAAGIKETGKTPAGTSSCSPHPHPHSFLCPRFFLSRELLICCLAKYTRAAGREEATGRLPASASLDLSQKVWVWSQGLPNPRPQLSELGHCFHLC
jgi:hypothetical protein